MSTPFEEWSVSFTPDGNTVYFSEGTLAMAICYSKKVNGKWGTPKVAPFSTNWQNWDPFVSPDGKRVFFVSNRSLADSAKAKPNGKTHLWYADNLGGDRWSAAKLIDEPFNLDGVNCYAHTADNDGTLYFAV